MASTESIGGVDISVSVDLSGLEAKFQAAIADAGADGQKIGQAIADGISSGAESGAAAFDAAMAKLVADGNTANEAFQKLTGSTQSFMDALQSGALSEFADNFGKIASEAQQAAPAIEQVATAAKDASAALGQMSQSGSGGFNIGDMFSGAKEGISSVTSEIGKLDQATVLSTGDMSAFATGLATMGGIALGLGGIKALISDMTEVTDSVNRAQISLTALTGDAGQAQSILTGLSQLGMADGLSMPGLRQAAISMEALLPAGTDIVGVLSQVADAAAVMGGSVEGVGMKLDRMVESGMLSARMIVGLGLTMDDITASMDKLGGASEVASEGLTKAFKSLDPEGRLMVVTDSLQKFQGVAEDVANNTFGSLWQKAANTFQSDMAAMGQSVLPFVQEAMPSIREAIDETFADLSRIKEAVQVTVDAIVGIFIALPAAVAGAMKMAADAAAGNWVLVASDAQGTANQLKTIWQGTMKEINSDVGAGAQAISDTLNHGVTIDLSARLGDAASQTKAAMADMASAVGATVVTVSGSVDSLAGHFTNVGKAAKMGMADAEAAVQSFDTTATTGAGTVGTLQAAFEKASKAITMVAKEDLPAAIKAVADYNQTMVDAGAKASVLDAGFLEQSKLVGQLAKTDLPGAVASMAELTKVYLDGNAPIALTNAAFANTEKQINALAKTDLPAAIEMQKNYLAVLENSAAPMNLMVQALEAQQKNFDALAKTNIQGAIDGLDKLADSEKNLNAPTQIVTATIDDERSKLDTLANTNIESAISQLDKLADHQKALNQPTQDVTKTLDDERSKLDTLANTNIEAAIAGLDKLAQHQIALNQPTQDVTKTLDDERSKLDLLANTNLEAAINGLDRLATEQIKLKQPTEDVTKTLDDERSKIDLLANSNLPAAIQRLSDLADKQVKLNQPTADVTKTLDDEHSKIDLLANSNLPAAIQQLSNLADQQVRLNQPTADVTKTLDDERSKIVALGASDVPAAVAALQGLINKQIALKQPTDDIIASIKAEETEIAKLANTDLPAAIAAHQTYLDQLTKENAIYIAINAEGAKTVQQQEFQIASQKELLDSVNSVNLAYGDRLAIEAKIAQEEINLGTAQGQNVEAQIWGLEKIKLAQEALVISTHGWADAETQALNDGIKGLENMGQSMANVIVNGGNMRDAIVADLKKIATTILTDLIDGALKQLAAALITAVTGVQTTFTAMSTGIGGIGAAATAATTGLTSLGSAATAAAAAISAAATAQAGASTAVATAAGGEAAAMAAEVGADTAATAATIADTSATVSDTAAAIADAAATGGEAAAMIAETGAQVADTAATIADTGATIADTGATIADTGATIADTAAEIADTATVIAQATADIADTAATIAQTAATIADTVAQIALTSVISAVAGIVGAIAGIVGDVYLAAIDTKLFSIETSTNRTANDLANLRADQWSQHNQMYDRIGEIENVTESIDASLKALVANGPGGSGGGGLNDSQSHNLQALADNIAPSLADLSDIDTRVSNIDSGVHQLDTDLNTCCQTLNSDLFIIIARLDSVIAAINYHGSSQSQSMQAQSMSLQSLGGTAATTGHAIVGAIDDQTGRQEQAAQQALGSAESQYAAALNIADQITALQGVINADKTLMADAINTGDFALAQQYANDIQQTSAKLDQLESATNAGAAQVSTSMSNVGTAIVDSQGRVIVEASANTGFIITAVDRNASVISNAISNVGSQIQGAMASAIAGLSGGTMSGVDYSRAGINSPGAGGTKPASGPYDPSTYNPPYTGGPGGAGPGAPLGPYSPGVPDNTKSPGVVSNPLPASAYTGFNAPPPPASSVVIPSPGIPVESGPKPEAPVSGPLPYSPSTATGPVAPPPVFSPGDLQYISSAVAAAINSGLAPLGTLQNALTSATSGGATPAQIEILKEEITAASAGAHQTYTSTAGSTNISSVIPGTVPMATNTGGSGASNIPAVIKASADEITQAQANAKKAVDDLSSQLAGLNQQLIVAEATNIDGANSTLVASIETQIGATNSNLGTANGLLNQINANIVTGTGTTGQVADNTKLTADTIAKATANENSVIDGLASHLSELHTELINALAADVNGSTDALVSSINTQIGNTNSQLSAANGLLQQIGGSTAATAAKTGSGAGTPPSVSPQPVTFSTYNPYGTPSNMNPWAGMGIPNTLPKFAEGGIMPDTGAAHLEGGEMVLPPDVSAMLSRMASTPDMSYSPRNPAASAAVAPGSVNIDKVTFNVYGGSAADNVRQICAYMKVVSPKLAALSS